MASRIPFRHLFAARSYFVCSQSAETTVCLRGNLGNVRGFQNVPYLPRQATSVDVDFYRSKAKTLKTEKNSGASWKKPSVASSQKLRQGRKPRGSELGQRFDSMERSSFNQRKRFSSPRRSESPHTNTHSRRPFQTERFGRATQASKPSYARYRGAEGPQIGVQDHYRASTQSRKPFRAERSGRTTQATKPVYTKYKDTEAPRIVRQEPSRAQPPNRRLSPVARLDRALLAIKPKDGAERKPRATPQIVRRTRRFPPNQLDVEVTCHPGLETVLSQELDALGIAHKIERNCAVLTNANLDTILSCHLYLGSASQVLLQCGTPFTARGLPELQRKVEKLPWKNLIQADAEVQVKVQATFKSKLLHSTAIRDRIIDGIKLSLGVLKKNPESDSSKSLERVPLKVPQESKGPKNEDGSQGPAVALTVRVMRDQVYLSLATSLTPLHQRGYRLESGKAPLREDLAYAMLYNSGWKPPSAARGESDTIAYDALVDPFCGSGTIAIEAACMAAGLPPGRLRSAPLEGTLFYDPAKWSKIVMKSLRESSSQTNETKIVCSDRNAGAVKIAKANAKRAGIPDMLDIQECAFTKHPWLDVYQKGVKPRSLLIAGNLPFGQRISPSKSSSSKKKPQFLPLYQSLSTIVKSYGDQSNGGTCNIVLLTNDWNLVQRGAFPGSVKQGLGFKHGGIDVSTALINSSSGETEDNESTEKQPQKIMD